MAESLLKPSWLLLCWRKSHWLQAVWGSHNEPETIRHRLQQGVLVRAGTLANLAEIKPNYSGFSMIWICMRRMWKPCESPPAQQTKVLQTLVLNNSSLVFSSEVISQILFLVCNTFHLVLTSSFIFFLPFTSQKY